MTTPPFDKRAVFEAEIEPLLQRAFALCAEHKIPLLAYALMSHAASGQDRFHLMGVRNTPHWPQIFEQIDGYVQISLLRKAHDAATTPVSAEYPTILWDDEP